MTNDQLKYAVGVFSSRQETEQALNQLNRSGFPMDKVSVIARDADRQDDIAGVDVSDRVGNKAVDDNNLLISKFEGTPAE
jgi:hypothetical protein